MATKKKIPETPVPEAASPASDTEDTAVEPMPESYLGINLGSNGLLSPGTTAEVVADIFPAKISPKPDMVPPGISKLRVIVTDKTLTLAWPGGFQNGVPVVNRYDVRLTDNADNASFQGGEVLADEGGDTGVAYTITRGNGCACGANGLKTWHPFPQVALSSRPRTGVVKASTPTSGGAIRYSRS